MPRKPNSIEIGITDATMSAARTLPRNTSSTVDHEQARFNQIARDGANRSVDHFRLVVERDRPCTPSGSRTREPLLHALDDAESVLAFQHDRHARDGFALAVAKHRTLARQRTDVNAGHIAYQHRRSAVSSEHDALDVVDVACAAKTANGVLLRRVLDETAAEIAVVLPEPFEHVSKREAVSAKIEGSTSTVYCRVSPPQLLTSFTPGTVRS